MIDQAFIKLSAQSPVDQLYNQEEEIFKLFPDKDDQLAKLSLLTQLDQLFGQLLTAEDGDDLFLNFGVVIGVVLMNKWLDDQKYEEFLDFFLVSPEQERYLTMALSLAGSLVNPFWGNLIERAEQRLTTQELKI